MNLQLLLSLMMLNMMQHLQTKMKQKFQKKMINLEKILSMCLMLLLFTSKVWKCFLPIIRLI